MRYGTFLGIVEEVSGLPHHDAERTVHAVVWILGWRISTGEAEDIAAFLPAELRATLTGAPESAQAFGLDEFVRRVAKLEGVDDTTAFEHARAVFVALGQAVAPGELSDPASQLSKDYEPLLHAADAGRRAAEERDDVIGRLAMITELNSEQARRATDAALEKLAVFAALRDVILSKEFASLAAQLARDYEPLVAASRSPSAATAVSETSRTGSGSCARSVGR